MLSCNGIAVSFILFAVVSAIGPGSAAGQTLDKQGSRVFPRRVQLLKDGYHGNYERSIIKNDIFIFQKKVVIDKLLETNGGNVLIVADEILLNAPIDTRVRFRMGPNYWAPATGDEAAGADPSLGFVLTRYDLPAAFRAFDSLYLWRESYNPIAKKFVYSVAPRPEKLKPPTEFPQLPSAQVPVASTNTYGPRYADVKPSDGADAPDGDVIWDNVRSGDIRIFTTKITLCAQCKRALWFKEALNPKGYSDLLLNLKGLAGKGARTPAVAYTGGTGKSYSGSSGAIGDPFDINQAVFLQASGLKGGRGAAGSTPYASFGDLAGMPGGLSGKPGRAGDGGSIELHFVNRQGSKEEQDLIKAAALADGGEPAQIFRQRTTSIVRLQDAGNRAAFIDEVKIPDVDVDKLKGRPGTISFDTVDTDTAIRAINARLLEAEITGNYAIDLLVAPIRLPICFQFRRSIRCAHFWLKNSLGCSKS